MSAIQIWEGGILFRAAHGAVAMDSACCCVEEVCECPAECLADFEVQIDGEAGSCWDANYSCYKSVSDYTDANNWYSWELTATLDCVDDEWTLLVAICGSETVDGVYTLCTNTWSNASPFSCESDGHPASGEVELSLDEGEVLCELETIVIPPTVEIVRS